MSKEDCTSRVQCECYNMKITYRCKCWYIRSIKNSAIKTTSGLVYKMNSSLTTAISQMSPCIIYSLHP